MNILNNTMEEFINKSNDKYKIDESNIFPILKLIELKLDLSININLYNPRLIIFISRVLTYLIQNKNNNNNNKINNISKFYPDINTKKFNIEKFIIEKSEETINKLVGNTKNDINYEIIFKIYVIINTNDIFKNNFSKFIFQIIIIKAIKIFRKKIHMNYLVIKKKPIQFLQPDYDLSFLGDFPEYVNIEEKNKKMNYILKHKTRNTEKQAIRKLKKEAKVLDEEREKVIDDINKKRKEDLKFVNQYLEQQNIEYKKMMSSNERKRFKFKKKKTGK